MNQAELIDQIEGYLLRAKGFVSTAELCSHFGIRDRILRQDGNRPALLDEFAVSSTQEGKSGFIHHRHLPEKEWQAIRKRRRDHGIKEVLRVRRWDKARHNILTGKRLIHELFYDQQVFPYAKL